MEGKRWERIGRGGEERGGAPYPASAPRSANVLLTSHEPSATSTSATLSVYQKQWSFVEFYVNRHSLLSDLHFRKRKMTTFLR